METSDRPPEEGEQATPKARSRPWGPGSPAPGTPVSAFDVGRDEDAKLRASEATALYEAARFPDLEEVVAPAPTGSSPGGGPDDQDAEAGGLRILGVPAPKEIAGPVLAGLGLVVLVYGWRRRRRRRRGGR